MAARTAAATAHALPRLLHRSGYDVYSVGLRRFRLNGSMRLRVSSAKSKTNDDNDLIMKQGLCGGVIKPNITFFGEKLGNEVGHNLQ